MRKSHSTNDFIFFFLESITDKTNHDLIIFACLWEYYLRNATDHIGWMISITKVLPRLIELKLGKLTIKKIQHSCNLI